MHWYGKVISNYVGFTGRARRKEYWMFLLFNIIISIILGIIEGISGSGLLSKLYSLFIFLPSLAVTVRRLHDTGKSGWWVLIGLVPIVGFIVLLIFTCLDSDPGTNQYGENPKDFGGSY
ncbi:uncharacterized membrane protein YhaH (DUF805 family) [Paenibacillus taihuensis]|uniref:Uncharacterized membrane protein YhaH (DUF805 family) n=1 Tax=Paenibacillus taihuensis TaxID=1156355 RepID=A0A3D9Q8J5_9BACL|nr:DUF805 domain-containing protein [Paenibacillus taihuensis]REE56267.1 uncharacterized membrane protein YhaH (DUF805 family) [Paenibacillus taihuensis]